MRTMSCVRCHVSDVTYHLSHIRCHVLHVNFHLSHLPTATANSQGWPTIYKRLVYKDPKKIYFIHQQFYLPFELKLRRQMCFQQFSVRNVFVINHFVLRILQYLKRGKYQNCHLVLKGSFWFFLVFFLVLFSSVFGSLVLFQFFNSSSSFLRITKIWKSESCNTHNFFF